MQKSRFLLVGFAFALACGTASVVNRAYVGLEGVVTGLLGTLVLQLNEAENLTITEDGDFVFDTRLEKGTDYKISVISQPEKQNCTITGGEGTIESADSPTISVACLDGDYSVGGTVSGLLGSLVIQNNSGDDLTITSDGAFSFPTPSSRDANYSVSILNQPRFQNCVVSGGSGTISTDVTTISIACTIQPMVAAGGDHICALSSAGKVRCWGSSSSGQTGYGLTTAIGDDELPSSMGDVDVGGTVLQLASGFNHTCALLATGAVRCWGSGSNGKLGYGNTENMGDNESPKAAGDVSIGGKAIQVSAGDASTCAVLESGKVRCWGWGIYGRTGQGNTNNIGDDELPSSVPEVNVGGKVTQIFSGPRSAHSCAVLETGALRCWGYGSGGALGYGNTDNIGDNEEPASAGDVNIGGTVKQVAIGSGSTCALLTTGAIRCFGRNTNGQLGAGNVTDASTPGSDVDVGGEVASLSMGDEHACALFKNGAVRCWGYGDSGRLGYGNVNNIGDDELPATAGDVSLGATAVAVSAGWDFSSALLSDGSIRAWGHGRMGRLGYGNTNKIGDDEVPSSVNTVSVW
jgi:alpha-tubulin suppressor-like RCC1 family protein